jgi:hypothetical protein
MLHQPLAADADIVGPPVESHASPPDEQRGRGQRETERCDRDNADHDVLQALSRTDVTRASVAIQMGRFKVSRALFAANELRRDEKAMAARLCRATIASVSLSRVGYCAEHVEAIMRTADTWMCWALDEAELPVDDALGGVLLDAAPPAPAVVVEPAPLVVDEELAGASVPVISTWWPLCCERSEAPPSRT